MEAPTVEWLRDQIVELLDDARKGEKVDHQACAKYAEILFKMLPKNEGNRIGDAVRAAREALDREGT